MCLSGARGSNSSGLSAVLLVLLLLLPHVSSCQWVGEREGGRRRRRGHNRLPPDCNIIRPAAAAAAKHSDMRRFAECFWGDVRNIFLAYEQRHKKKKTEIKDRKKKWKRDSVWPAAMLQLVLAIVRRPQVESESESVAPASCLRFIHSHCMDS